MNFPQFFYFINDKCFFSDEIVSEYNFKCEVFLRREYNQTLTLIGNQKEPFNIVPQITKDLISVCKSNLQKCIRRNEHVKAVKTAFAIFSIEPVQLLRRLPMILIEDSLPFFSLIKVVWWSIAVGKGYKLCKDEIEELMGIVMDASETDTYVKCKFSDNVNFKIQNNLDFFRMLELRKLYGGMPQDLQMINYHIHLWSEKFLQDEIWIKTLDPDESTLINLNKIGKFSEKDILLESIDYHPYPWILKKLPHDSKKLIWHFRSKINLKKPLFSECRKQSDEDKEMFENIKKNLDNLCIWIKENIIRKNIC